ncbi:hypothetical protein [Candidatus Uabimicrobium sp. HlEnr_7]|uniref:hypothetical protein n=1 Tax=Candidatus Uabimicrobium helgolandensis TaxID=3095367 RepID=UPI0035575A46
MRKIHILLAFCIVFCSCLNRDNLAPYQTNITKNRTGTSMLTTEKSNIIKTTKSLKEMSTDIEETYNNVHTAYTTCLEELRICCEQDNIKRPKYQDALTNLESKYQEFFAHAKDNKKSAELSEDIYPLEVAMKRIFNKYRRGNQQTKTTTLASIDNYKLPAFDKL